VNLACKASSLTIVTRYQRACLCITTTTRSNFRRGARGSLVAGMLYTLILRRVMSYLKLSSDFLRFVNQRRQEYFQQIKKYSSLILKLLLECFKFSLYNLMNPMRY